MAPEAKDERDAAHKAENCDDYAAACAHYATALALMENQPASDDSSLNETRLEIIDVRVDYAKMHLRWAVQPGNAEGHTAFSHAERQLQLAEGTISDILGHLNGINPDKIEHKAGEIYSLFGRLFTTMGTVAIEACQSSPGTERDFQMARLFYSGAERHFRRSHGYNRHERIMNMFYAARQECAANAGADVKRWLGKIPLQRRLQWFSDHDAKRTSHAIAQHANELADRKAAIQAILLQP